MKLEDMTKEELIEYINNLNENENGKYGLIRDKEKEPEQIVVDCDKNIPLLSEITEKSVSNGGTDNYLIEGDNFHALTVLNYTHKEAIDVIYIDPPYNTGNEDFMYNDKFVDTEDSYRHSKWLNFMGKRLKLARNLLKENGLIFISIGDDEFAQLKLLCDKIFNEKNFITSFTWIQTSNPPSLGRVRNNMEYVLCYQKQSNQIKLYGRSSNEKDSPLANASNSFAKVIIPKKSCHFTNVFEDLVIGKGKKPSGVVLHDDIIIKDQLNQNDFTVEFNSKWGQDNINNEIKMGSFFIVKDYNYFSIRYQKGNIGYVVPDKFLDPSKFDVKDNEYGRKQLETLIGKNKFSYPKNTPLIKTLINMYGKDKKDSIILDFFAGSGTTGQAVLEMNNEDGGNRQFILCTNNEISSKDTLEYLNDNGYLKEYKPTTDSKNTIIKNKIKGFFDENPDIKQKLIIDGKVNYEKYGICQSVTYPRLKTVITGKRMDGTEYSEGLEGSLKYFKTEFVANEGTKDQLYFDLTEKCIPMLHMKEDTFIEVESNDEYSIYTNNDKSKYTCVYFDIIGEKYDEFKEKLKNIKENKSLYIFTLGEGIDESDLNGINNYKVEAIPQKIYELYKKVVKISKKN